MEEQRKPVIRIFPSRPNPQGDCGYLAVAEDGEEVAFHVSSSEGYGRYDMGLTMDNHPKHALYKAKYPSGYTLQWVADWTKDEFLSGQAKANKAATPKEGP